MTAHSGATGGLVIVVEDEPAIADLLRLYLTRAGFTCHLVADGAAALADVAALCLLDEGSRLIQDTTSYTRDIMSELRPPLLDEFGLPDALEWYVGKVAERADLAICLQAEQSLARLCPEAENALFRIAQEAINNALKHAQATTVTVSLWQQDRVAVLVVADDGTGFDPVLERTLGRAPHWGLLTMRERVLGVGGFLRVESQTGIGTRIVVEVPV